LNFVKNFSELSIDLVKDIKVELEKPQIDKEYIGEMFTDLILNQERIQQHGNRASSIVKGMLEHSRTSKGKREWIDINQLADEYLRLSYHGLRARDKSFNADYKTELSDSLTKIQVIPEDFGRVILNLINNAFYAVNDRKKRDTSGSYKPKVTVTTQLNNKQIIIKVIDNGTGIPKEIREKIFQPFFTTKPSGEGTGLGLSLSHEIVTKGHSGTLEVQSEEGEGGEPA
jgi:signal transduction histidine kinase